MAIDYREVLRELRAEEVRLDAELETIRMMIPGAELMVSRMPPVPVFSDPEVRAGVFASMGTKEAILTLLEKRGEPLMPSDITRLLIAGGIQTRSTDFASTVGSTLNQMKGDEVERIESGWRIRHANSSLYKAVFEAPSQ